VIGEESWRGAIAALRLAHPERAVDASIIRAGSVRTHDVAADPNQLLVMQHRRIIALQRELHQAWARNAPVKPAHLCVAADEITQCGDDHS